MGEQEAREQALVEALASVVGRRHVLTSLPDRLAYSRDCWPEGIILARGGRLMLHRPAAIVQPADEAQVAAVMQVIQSFEAPVVPYGAGSGVCGGALPDRGGVVVDVKRLSAIEHLDVQGLKARVGAGAIGMILETELERRGLTLGHFPSSLYCSSLGGYLAARSAGQCSSRFGKIEDMVQSLRVVTNRGDIWDSAPGPGADRWPGGPDATQLVVGSEGTLGIITSGVLRLHRAPEARIYRGFRCESVQAGLDAIREVMQAGLRPTVLRLYDEFDTLIAGSLSPKAMQRAVVSDDEEALPEGLLGALRQAATGLSLPERLRRRGGVLPQLGERVRRATRGLLGRAIGQPLILNQLAEALPGGCLLVVGFEGERAAAHREAEAGFSIFSRTCVDFGPGPGEHWLKNRFNVSYKQSPMFEAGAFVDTMEVATTWSNLLPLYEAVKQAVAPHAFIMAHFSHAYGEGASIYFTFAGFGADVDETLEAYQRVWSSAQEAVARTGACVSHHHGVGLSKAAWVPRDQRGGRALYEALGAAWDREGLLNPGKVWPVPHADKVKEPVVEVPRGGEPEAGVWQGGEVAPWLEKGFSGLAVLRPSDVGQVACALRQERPGALFPLGGGRHGRRAPGKRDVVLDLRGLDRVLGWDARSRVIKVEAGVTVAALAQALEERGGSLAGWRREHPASTVGGLLGRYLPTQPALWNGSVREACVALGGLMPDGRGYDYVASPRKASGPDLRHLFLGAEGAFGIITSASLGVAARPMARRALDLSFAQGELGAGLRWLQELFARGFRAPNVLWSGAARRASALLEGDRLQVELMAQLWKDVAAEAGLVAEEADPQAWYDPAAGDVREGADPLGGRAASKAGALALWGGLLELAQLPERALSRAVVYDISHHQASLWLPGRTQKLGELGLEELRRARVGWWRAEQGLVLPQPEARERMRRDLGFAKEALDPRGVLPQVEGL